MDWTQLLQLGANFDQHLGGFVAQYGTAVYAVLFMIVFCEIGLLPLFFLPGDPLLFVVGAFGAAGAISVWIAAPLLFVAALSGSVLSYSIGRAVGGRVFTNHSRWIDRSALHRTRSFYENHGGLTFLLSPYIGIVRTFAPFVAGVAAMTFARFVPQVAAGATLWVASLVTGGYFFGELPFIHDHLGTIVLLGVAAGLGAFALGGAWRWVQARKAR